MNANVPVINLSAKPSKSQFKFNRHIREERGNCCQICGATADKVQIDAHHVLDRRIFPAHAKNPSNILIVCQPCHTHLTDCTGNMSHGALESYASLPEEIRLTLASFIEQNEPRLSTLIQALRRGHGYAKAVFWWKTEHRTPHPPEAYIQALEKETAEYDEWKKSQPAKTARPIPARNNDQTTKSPKNPTSLKALKKLRKRLQAEAQKQRNLDDWCGPRQAMKEQYGCSLRGIYK